ncbi:MAG: hypothetical protein LBD31_07445 [Treponema sp.]|jgi:hypothetical protein|nr:hypothetical protein [Treponema sp.]
MNASKKLFLILFLALPLLVWGETRGVPVDMYIIVDGSSAMERGRNEALTWICGKIDGLQDGDRIWIWRAGTKAELIYSGTSGTDKEDIKRLVRSIKFEGDAADYRSALRDALGLTGGNKGRLAYTLLISGAGAKNSRGEPAELLRYSRVENFSGWRALTIGLDLGPKVRQALSYYLDDR